MLAPSLVKKLLAVRSISTAAAAGPRCPQTDRLRLPTSLDDSLRLVDKRRLTRRRRAHFTQHNFGCFFPLGATGERSLQLAHTGSLGERVTPVCFFPEISLALPLSLSLSLFKVQLARHAAARDGTLSKSAYSHHS